MRPALTTWLLGGILALGTTAAWAQVPPASEEREQQVTTTETTTTTTTMEGHTITKEEVKTWTMEIEGKEYEVHPATPTSRSART